MPPTIEELANITGLKFTLNYEAPTSVSYVTENYFVGYTWSKEYYNGHIFTHSRTHSNNGYTLNEAWTEFVAACLESVVHYEGLAKELRYVMSGENDDRR